MEILNAIHWQTITPELRQLMQFVAQQSFSSRFYLAGGTALALQLGHRQSLLIETPWEIVKEFFITQSKMLAEKWF